MTRTTAATPYQPLVEVTRGTIVESIHFGAFAVVDVHGRLLASYGDPYAVTYLRSSTKPFQALPLIERKGHEIYHLSLAEIALACASHSGTDEHVLVVRSLQDKAGIAEADLLCGVHPLEHQPTVEAMRQRGEQLTPNRHNCSGKHSAMLALAQMLNLPKENYIHPEHPIQRLILQTFAEMCALPVEQVVVGTDGCSAPNFAVPLYHAALAFARLCDPQSGGVQPLERAQACQVITAAMSAHPEMVAGPQRFDTRLMQTAPGRILAKGGAEGYQAMGLLPGALGSGSSALGIAIKISDGDQAARARAAVSLEILRQLGALSPSELEGLANYGPHKPLYNWRKIVVGEVRPCFGLVL